ncbi:MAG: class I tRNA ligase family protein, partial [Rectinemataceae bacterium]|nr:class I tRNA ligase family protein [Rectinemataceae bacterium]
FHSPFLRTKETAEVVVHALGLETDICKSDERLKEIGPTESLVDVARRVGDFMYEVERKYSHKKILIISHGSPLQYIERLVTGQVSLMPNTAEIHALPFVPLPHNDTFELDLHRPYIDECVLVAPDGTRLERVHDVFDCWFESGSMSFAQNHYPFENKNVFDPAPGWFRGARGYPADFIAEGLDQTRGWFYSLLVLGVALFGRSPYKQVIVNGTVLAEDGQKMSKKLQNYPDPLEVINKHGADAVRYYLLSSPLLRGQDLNFSEKGVQEIASKLIGRFRNVLSFYELYKNEYQSIDTVPSTHVLDQWIMMRVSETVALVEKGMESYEVDRAMRPIMDFVDDLSTWYVRRSRNRPEALGTLRSVLETTARVLAPFTPFIAEEVFQKVRTSEDPESVHLTDWPVGGIVDQKLIRDMEEVRRVVTMGLEKRQNENIKVRQPLNKFIVHSSLLIGKQELLDLIKDEMNVKEVIVDATIEGVQLDT